MDAHRLEYQSSQGSGRAAAVLSIGRIPRAMGTSHHQRAHSRAKGRLDAVDAEPVEPAELGQDAHAGVGQVVAVGPVRADGGERDELYAAEAGAAEGEGEGEGAADGVADEVDPAVGGGGGGRGGGGDECERGPAADELVWAER